MSGKRSTSFIDFTALSFEFDRVCCALARSFLVRNWCDRWPSVVTAGGRAWPKELPLSPNLMPASKPSAARSTSSSLAASSTSISGNARQNDATSGSSRIGTTERGMVRRKSPIGRCPSSRAAPLAATSSSKAGLARARNRSPASVRPDAAGRADEEHGADARLKCAYRLTDRRWRYPEFSGRSAETTVPGDTQERLHAVERTVSDCEVLLHSPSTLSRIVARGKRPYIRVANYQHRCVR